MLCNRLSDGLLQQWAIFASAEIVYLLEQRSLQRPTRQHPKRHMRVELTRRVFSKINYCTPGRRPSGTCPTSIPIDHMADSICTGLLNLQAGKNKPTTDSTETQHAPTYFIFEPNEQAFTRHCSWIFLHSCSRFRADQRRRPFVAHATARKPFAHKLTTPDISLPLTLTRMFLVFLMDTDPTSSIAKPALPVSCATWWCRQRRKTNHTNKGGNNREVVGRGGAGQGGVGGGNQISCSLPSLSTKLSHRSSYHFRSLEVSTSPALSLKEHNLPQRQDKRSLSYI